MYEPVFNSVLVEINDEDAEWGTGNDESMLGASYSKGTVVEGQTILVANTQAYPISNPTNDLVDTLNDLIGKQIMWNEGVEAGTTFEHDGKLYGMIYWWDIRGVKSDAK